MPYQKISSMKPFKLILFATLLFVCSCTNEMVNESSDISPKSELSQNESIRCIDGTMHFPTAESCIQTMESLTSEAELNAFEKKYHFVSWRTQVDMMLDDIIACETPEEYQSVLETCEGYLKEDEDRLMPVITSVGYASIANLDGVFYVGDVKHIVDGNSVSVEISDPITRSIKVEKFDYIVPFKGVDETRSDSQLKYTDERRETSKYKVFARTNVLRHTVVEQVNGKNSYNTSFAVQVHVSGQKKKFLIGWNTYKDRFYVENLHWDLNISGKRISFLKYRDEFSQSEETKNLYVTVPFGTGQFIGTPSEVPMPLGFNCIVHRARSSSMGKCGALTDINCCMPLVTLPLSACVE